MKLHMVHSSVGKIGKYKHLPDTSWLLWVFLKYIFFFKLLLCVTYLVAVLQILIVVSNLRSLSGSPGFHLFPLPSTSHYLVSHYIFWLHYCKQWRVFFPLSFSQVLWYLLETFYLFLPFWIKFCTSFLDFHRYIGWNTLNDLRWRKYILDVMKLEYGGKYFRNLFIRYK